MKKFIFIISILLGGCSVMTPLQKSKFLTVSNLIDAAKFAEAKEVVEELVSDKESAKWARTWYLRGVLCQTAYHEGVKKNDKNLRELYPDQLFVAHRSFQRASSLDKAGRLDRQIATKYVLLANELQKIGEAEFKAKRFSESLRAFEHAFSITQSPILSMEIDQNLVYNTSLAAYESNDWEKAIKHLSILHKNKYSTNATHLLSNANLEKGDTIAAIKVLKEGVQYFDYNEDLVLLLTDLYYTNSETDSALKLLNDAIAKKPDTYKFYFTKGLVFQKNARYAEAIESYSSAIKLAPNSLPIYLSIATSFYNTGVEIEEKTRSITSSREVQEQKAKSSEAFDSAIEWLDKIYEKGTKDQDILYKSYELYRALRVNDKAKNLESQLR
jgi:tetratricopeptide (TPR) repeat protein